MSRLAILFVAFVAAQVVHAGPGTEAPVHPNYDSPFDNIGLCTQKGNVKNHYYASGHCKTIFETLANKKVKTVDGEADNCTEKLVEQLRLRMVNDEESQKKLKGMKAKQTEPISFGIECRSQNNPEEENINKIAKDPVQFRILLMQLFAAIAIQESKWRVNIGGDASQNRNVKCTTHCGLLGLNESDMQKPGPNALPDEVSCGCKKAFDPTMDGHSNLRCGISMALTEVLNEKEPGDLFGGGRPKGPNQEKDSRTGMAKIFKSLEARDVPPGSKELTPVAKIKEKLKNYCLLEAHANTNNNDLTKDLGGDNGQPNQILKGVRDAETTR